MLAVYKVKNKCEQDICMIRMIKSFEVLSERLAVIYLVGFQIIHPLYEL